MEKEYVFRFTGEVYIKARYWEEAREFFENMPLFSADALDCYADMTDYIQEEVD